MSMFLLCHIWYKWQYHPVFKSTNGNFLKLSYILLIICHRCYLISTISATKEYVQVSHDKMSLWANILQHIHNLMWFSQCWKSYSGEFISPNFAQKSNLSSWSNTMYAYRLYRNILLGFNAQNLKSKNVIWLWIPGSGVTHCVTVQVKQR